MGDGDMDDEALKALYGRMTEKALQDVVTMAGRLAGWLVYHTHDSRRSEPGFPDLVLLRGKRVLWRELKTQTGKLTAEQAMWLDALQTAGQDAAVWRPYDWGRGDISKTLEE